MAKTAKKNAAPKEPKAPKVTVPESTLKIIKVKVLGDVLTLTMQETKNGVVSKPFAESFSTPVHPDLKEAIAGLAVHQGLINGSIKRVSNIDQVKPKMLEELKPTGYGINAKETGIQITGMVKTDNGQYTTYNTVSRLYEEDSATAYPHMDKLIQQRDKIDWECREFLAGRKVGQAQQTEMEFEPEEE